jgi:DNA-binding SARP family transcriptional activator
MEEATKRGLDIRLLGRFEVLRAGQRVPERAWRSQNAKAMLAYLALEGEVSRDRLVATFWPDCEYGRARHNMNSTIRYIRQALEDGDSGSAPIIVYRHGFYAIDPHTSFKIDVDEFKRLLSLAREAQEASEAASYYRAAVRLWRGEFMEGFYHEWILAERERLQGQYIEALEGLARSAYSLGEYHQVIDYCQEILKVNACWEEAHWLIIEAALKLGRRGRAIYQWQLMQKTLQDQLGVPPGEAVELYQLLSEG